MNKEETDKFLKELSALTRKYNIVIDGCGCCESPWIEDLEGDLSNYEYVAKEELGYDYLALTWSEKEQKELKVSFSLYYYGESLLHPRDIPDPVGSKKVKWEAHPIVDSIHITYEFDSKSSREVFLKNPPEVFSRAKFIIGENA